MRNPDPESQEIRLSIDLPDNALIHTFIMTYAANPTEFVYFSR